MGQFNAPGINKTKDAGDLAEQLAILIKELDFLNGYIDDKNIKAASITAELIKAGVITADKMNVTQLSAIAANLGTITAGTLSTNAEINVGTDATIGNNLNLGESSSVSQKKVTWSTDAGISAYLSVLSGDMSINLDGFLTLTLGSSQGLVVNQVVDAAALKSDTITNKVGVSVVFSGTTTSDTAVSDSHDHNIADTDYIQCYDSAGNPTSLKKWSTFAGSPAHNHSVT